MSSGERPIGAAKGKQTDTMASCQPPSGRDALDGNGPKRRPQKRLDRRLEEVAKAVGGGYCRLQMPLSMALAVRGTVAGHRLGALATRGRLRPASWRGTGWVVPSCQENSAPHVVLHGAGGVICGPVSKTARLQGPLGNNGRHLKAKKEENTATNRTPKGNENQHPWRTSGLVPLSGNSAVELKKGHQIFSAPNFAIPNVTRSQCPPASGTPPLSNASLSPFLWEWTVKRVKRPPQQPAQPPVRQRRGSANAETTPAGAPAAAADRKQRPDATREGKNG